MLAFSHFNAVKAEGDVIISDSAIGAVAFPGAHIKKTGVFSQIYSRRKNEGVFKVFQCTINIH